jgi:Uma2 family endonuclease
MTIESDARRSPTPYAPPLVSWEDFLAWLREDIQAEWVDGEIIKMSPASSAHQRLVRFLSALLQYFVEYHLLGEILPSPFLMRLADRRSGREPDLLFVTTEHADRVRETYLDGPADLVVEVVSLESTIRDRRDKFLEYQAAKIPEYWLLDQPRQEAYFYVLDANGRYQLIALSSDGIYASTMLTGLRLPVEWLWRSPLPTLREAQTALLG